MAKKVGQELIPALGIAGESVEAGSAPANREGYDLYLRSLAVPHDPGPKEDAIAVLEKAVQLDPNYAPAWEALGTAITLTQFTQEEARPVMRNPTRPFVTL